MRNDLVAEEVEIDPFVSGSALLASKLLTVERARFGEVANGKGEVKSGAVRASIAVSGRRGKRTKLCRQREVP